MMYVAAVAAGILIGCLIRDWRVDRRRRPCPHCRRRVRVIEAFYVGPDLRASHAVRDRFTPSKN